MPHRIGLWNNTGGSKQLSLTTSFEDRKFYGIEDQEKCEKLLM